MEFVFSLLIVEDDATETKGWQDLLNIENAKENGVSFNPLFAKSFEEAEKLIEEFDFNAAIVDLRLEQAGTSSPNNDGNKVINKILDSEIAVTVAFTGEPANIDLPDWAKPVVKVTRKGGEESEGKDGVLAFLNENIGMLKTMAASQKRFKTEMAKLFSRSIWPRWKNWIATDGDNYQTALERHVVSHIHETLLESHNQKVHPEEWYFIPAIGDEFRTGDLIKYNNKYWTVITPRCDLANNKIEFIHLAHCMDVATEWRNCCEELNEAKQNLTSNTNPDRAAKLQEKINSRSDALRRFTQHRNNKASVHFLPELKLQNESIIGPFCVEFPNIVTFEKSDNIKVTELKSNRIGSIAPEFLPSLVERLGTYFSRIGTPDYSHPD